MKWLDLKENNVVDFASRLDKKKDEEYSETEQIKERVLSQIDYTANDAIEQFKRMGVDPDVAMDTVVSHLSDLVMMFDMQKRLK